MDEFESFDTKSFVGRLLGKGDWGGFMDKIKVGRGEYLVPQRCLDWPLCLVGAYALAAVASQLHCLVLAWYR